MKQPPDRWSGVDDRPPTPYEPYGKTTISGTASSSFFGFTGRENDSTGTLSLYNYRARAYSPALSCFLTEDAFGVAAKTVNLYEYALGSPTTFTDRLGLESNGCGFLGAGCWDAETVFGLSIGLGLAGLFFWGLAGGGAVLFGVALSASLASSFAMVTTVAGGGFTWITASSGIEKVLATISVLAPLVFSNPLVGVGASLVLVSFAITNVLVAEATD